ncbi:MAG: hypothetical protein IPH12_06330 [Saprospirales bacterium]|nr:hypothetical protein [Saprospirales bacterium]
MLNAAGDVMIPPVYDNVFYANFRDPGLFRVTLNGVTVMRNSAGAIYPDLITYPALRPKCKICTRIWEVCTIGEKAIGSIFDLPP